MWFVDNCRVGHYGGNVQCKGRVGYVKLHSAVEDAWVGEESKVQ